MASSKEYLDFILEQLSGLEDIDCRPMMGEYLIYYRGRLTGGVYDDRFLVKDTVAARALLADVREEIPYPGARPMLLVEDLDDKGFLGGLIEAMYPELPEAKKRPRRRGM